MRGGERRKWERELSAKAIEGQKKKQSAGEER